MRFKTSNTAVMGKYVYNLLIFNKASNGIIIRIHFHTFGTEFKQTTQTLKFTFTVFYYEALVIKRVED